MMSNKLTDIEGFFLGGKTIREDATGVVLGILIYHIKDSASIFLNNGYHQDRNEFYKYISTISDIDNKNRIITARTEIKISDSLLQIMTKDTALTDSIFNLK
ncbi:MAG: hypothetical protein M0Q54_12225 [Pigmentiphaga sp.]|nr:hypothetical protein [Pigmentiphaga sp.]